MEITLEQLNTAFAHAEGDTALMFDGKTCSMITIHGEDTCPICFFTGQVKAYLGIENSSPALLDQLKSDLG